MEQPRPLSALWYLFALLLALIGWNVGVAVAGGAWDSVRAAPITSANQPLSAHGASVAVFTDVVQVDRTITCHWKRAVDGSVHAIAPAPIALTVDDDGTTWHLIGFEPKGVDGMDVSCAPKDKGPDTSQYAYAIVDGFDERAMTGNVIILVTLLASFGIATVTFFRRRRQLRED